MLQAMRAGQVFGIHVGSHEANFEEEFNSEVWPSAEIFDSAHWISEHDRYLNEQERVDEKGQAVSKFSMNPTFVLAIISTAEDEPAMLDNTHLKIPDIKNFYKL